MMGETTIAKLVMLLIVGSIATLGMFGFANDLSTKTGLTYSNRVKNSTDTVINDLKQISANLTSSTTDTKKSWLETSFTLIFKIPSALGAIFSIPNIALNMAGEISADAGYPIPSWVTDIVYLVTGLIVVFGVIALITKMRL